MRVKLLALVVTAATALSLLVTACSGGASGVVLALREACGRCYGER
jgi:hypothetical protein